VEGHAGREQRASVNVSEAMSLAQGGRGHARRANHSALGFEYQVLDDARHEDGKLPTHRAAGLYDLIAPTRAET